MYKSIQFWQCSFSSLPSLSFPIPLLPLLCTKLFNHRIFYILQFFMTINALSLWLKARISIFYNLDFIALISDEFYIIWRFMHFFSDSIVWYTGKSLYNAIHRIRVTVTSRDILFVQKKTWGSISSKASNSNFRCLSLSLSLSLSAHFASFEK